MNSFAKAIMWGFLVSFLGSIPLGSLNSLTVQISHAEGFYSAIQYVLGLAIAEVIHVGVTLVSLKWILRNKHIVAAMQWVTIVLFTAMAVACFYSYFYPSGKTGNVMFEKLAYLPRIVIGFSLSIIDMMPIPFWFLWTTVLIAKKRLIPTPNHYKLYAFGIFIGTITTQCCYIVLGNWLINTFNAEKEIINLIVGVVMAISVVVQVYKKFFGKNPFEKIEQDPTIQL
jgi:threonine/homoserine/homoserine lactone efflux protein